MKMVSWDSANLDRWRMTMVVCSSGAAAGAAVLGTTFAILGGVSVFLALAVGAAVSYTLASYPRRDLERAALVQAREAPVLAASAAVFLESTRSRAKTILMLRSDEPYLRRLIEDTKKSTLLGFDSAVWLESKEGIEADSVASILGSIARSRGDRLDDEGEELEGIVRASLSDEEGKFPVFLAVAFFTPIMMMLLASVGHHDDPGSMAALAFLEVVILDLALSFASTERKRLSA